ncbi:transporter [Thalassotalea crassostreae]|uniref:transporter n=1 Tax=Thalassotalea crassostreae TaxID=1763536 RepID=UPI000838600E|nr:transporter [Thalassotalea crassostreae]
MYNNRYALTTVLLCGLSSVSAQELDPRSYLNLPIGQNFAAVVYGRVEGDLYLSPDSAVDDLKLDIDSVAVAYARTFELFGNSSKFDMSVGRGCVDGSARFQGPDGSEINGEPVNNGDKIYRDWCGYTDTKMRLNYNFYGAKAMEMKDFVKQPKGIVVGSSIQVSIPTADYDSDYVLNLGGNRWWVKPEIGASFPVGRWEWDIAVSAKIFGDNDELQNQFTLEQDPIYNIQSHLIYDIAPGQWIALNGNYFFGGDTFIDGARSSNKEGNYRAGFTYSFALNSQHSIKFLANMGVTTRRGNDTDVYALAYAYRWE